ncbi:hypothetical protein P7C70_g2635, partial [Phenoliferia sp. Uapishka_3]
MAASLSGIPSIALSFGLMTGYKPPSSDLVDGAIKASCEVVKKLWEEGWSGENEEKERVDVYSVNVPILPTMIQPGGPYVQWTTMARTQYSRLFKSVSTNSPSSTFDTGGPSAIPENLDEHTSLPQTPQIQSQHLEVPLAFVFSPDIGQLINPTPESLESGTDTHALHEGAIAVTPIRAAFEPAKAPEWKWRL